MDRTVMITGATSGFGKATAMRFAASGDHLILTGRRKDRLENLEREIRQKYNVKVSTLNFDMRNRIGVFQAVESLAGEWRNINILVNNAGLALGRDYFEEADLDDWETMIDTNLKGVIYMTRAVLPLMIQAGRGHIINMGSIAGKEVYEKGNVYCASKHGLDALSQSMRVDLLRHGIRVTAIHPGAAVTEFSLVRFKGDATKADAVYQGFRPLVAEDIADCIHYCAGLPPHVCINELVIMPVAQASAVYFHKA